MALFKEWDMIRFLKRRIVNTFLYSVDGIKAAWKMEEAFRIESILALPLLIFAMFLPVTNIEKALLIGSVLLVLITELLNAGLEKTIDRISTHKHPLSKMVKDMGSAAVLFALLNGMVIWSLIVVIPFFKEWIV